MVVLGNLALQQSFPSRSCLINLQFDKTKSLLPSKDRCIYTYMLNQIKKCKLLDGVSIEDKRRRYGMLINECTKHEVDGRTSCKPIPVDTRKCTRYGVWKTVSWSTSRGCILPSPCRLRTHSTNGVSSASVFSSNFFIFLALTLIDFKI